MTTSILLIIIKNNANKSVHAEKCNFEQSIFLSQHHVPSRSEKCSNYGLGVRGVAILLGRRSISSSIVYWLRSVAVAAMYAECMEYTIIAIIKSTSQFQYKKGGNDGIYKTLVIWNIRWLRNAATIVTLSPRKRQLQLFSHICAAHFRFHFQCISASREVCKRSRYPIALCATQHI